MKDQRGSKGRTSFNLGARGGGVWSTPRTDRITPGKKHEYTSKINRTTEMAVIVYIRAYHSKREVSKYNCIHNLLSCYANS
jgi:hypothetical protein